ncbi:hypothetical protein [Streptomyces sp. NPDC050264]|uniref:hypothetical protein n=1 Tax=Streptomyces sp. NPDC050264 TaxID=3155038 RepID=UPI00343E1736
MPAQPVRRLATSVLCASLLIGAASPAFAADSGDGPVGPTGTSAAPVPGAAALLAQAKVLHDAGGVLTPVSDLITAVLKANGKLDPKDAKKLADPIKTAIDTAKKTAATPVPKTAGGAVPDDAKAPLDVRTDALAVLQSAVDALVKAATSGDAGAVATQVPAVVTGLVNVLAATLLGSGLPAPSLSGLPALPKLPTSGQPGPATSALPLFPTLPQTPALPETPLFS